MNDASPDTRARPAPDPADAGHARLPEAVWDEIRADYLAGWSAPACCRRYGVGLSALRGRAAEEGWRRSDQPWDGPRGLDRDDEGLALEESVDGDLERISLGDLSVVACQRMMRAVLHGDAMAALRWRRVHQALADEHRRLTRLVEQAGRRREADEKRRLLATTDALRAETRVMEAELRRFRAARGRVRAPTGPNGPDDPDDLDGVFASPPSAAVLPGLPGGAPLTGPP